MILKEQMEKEVGELFDKAYPESLFPMGEGRERIKKIYMEAWESAYYRGCCDGIIDTMEILGLK